MRGPHLGKGGSFALPTGFSGACNRELITAVGVFSNVVVAIVGASVVVRLTLFVVPLLHYISYSGLWYLIFVTRSGVL